MSSFIPKINAIMDSASWLACANCALPVSSTGIRVFLSPSCNSELRNLNWLLTFAYVFCILAMVGNVAVLSWYQANMSLIAFGVICTMKEPFCMVLEGAWNNSTHTSIMSGHKCTLGTINFANWEVHILILNVSDCLALAFWIHLWCTPSRRALSGFWRVGSAIPSMKSFTLAGSTA